MNEIQVQIKSVYGNERIYPVCDKAELFAKLAGKKTFDRRDIQMIKDLGFDVVVVQQLL